jgi:hypothetical protein
MVKVADDLTALAAPSLFREAHIHRLDLTHSTIWSRSSHSHRHRHPLPEFVSTARTSPRPLQPVHASPLDQDLLLILSATEPAPADRRSTLGKLRLIETLARRSRLHSVWAGLAQIRCLLPDLFFRELISPFLKIPSSLKIHRNYFMHPNLVIPISMGS